MAHVKEKFVCPVLRLGLSYALSSSTETPTVLINSKIPQEVVEVSMNLLLLDEIILSKTEFQDFCADMYTLECYITAVSHMSSKVWHAGMLKKNFKHAAQSRRESMWRTSLQTQCEKKCFIIFNKKHNMKLITET